MRLRFWNSRKSSTLVMMEGCLERPKTSAPRRKTRVATYWFAPLMRLTTAMTEVTPITTPISVSTLRSLCAQRLDVAIDTASVRCMLDARGIAVASWATYYYTQREVAELRRKGTMADELEKGETGSTKKNGRKLYSFLPF